MTATYTIDLFSSLDGLAAGLVDRLQVTIFPVITGLTGEMPVFAGLGDYDLELLEQRTLDARSVELIYRPATRTW